MTSTPDPLKHGLYGRIITRQDLAALRKMPCNDLSPEIAVLRLMIASLLELKNEQKDVESTVLISNAITRAIRALFTLVNIHIDLKQDRLNSTPEQAEENRQFKKAVDAISARYMIRIDNDLNLGLDLRNDFGIDLDDEAGEDQEDDEDDNDEDDLDARPSDPDPIAAYLNPAPTAPVRSPSTRRRHPAATRPAASQPAASQPAKSRPASPSPNTASSAPASANTAKPNTASPATTSPAPAPPPPPPTTLRPSSPSPSLPPHPRTPPTPALPHPTPSHPAPPTTPVTNKKETVFSVSLLDSVDSVEERTFKRTSSAALRNKKRSSLFLREICD